MRIALLSLPKEYKRFEENIQVTSEEFGVHPPLGLSYVAALVREHEHNPIIIDACNLKLSKANVLRQLKKFRPDLIGIEIHSIYYIHSYIEWIKYIKYNTNLPVMVGGAGFSLYPREIMSYGVVDYGLTGAIIDSLPQLLAGIENCSGYNTYKKIPGLYFKFNNRIYGNKSRSLCDDIDSLPFPARDLLKNEIYHQFITKRKNFTILLTSTGCGLGCTFCDARTGKFKSRLLKRVIEEIKECYYKYNIKEIDFFDRTFTLDRNRVIRLCTQIIKDKLDISWSCRTRIDMVDKELLDIMKRAGCFAIFYGIESADEKILTNINKRINLDKIRATINATKRAGIKSLGFFMFGNPGDTEKSIKKTIEFALSLNLSYATFTKAIAKPKSYYDEINKKKSGKDFWEDYILGKCKATKPIRTWTPLDDKVLDKYVKEAFFRFYFRPKYAINFLLDIKSSREFLRYFKSTLKFLFYR